jgi:hypothetical protein
MSSRIETVERMLATGTAYVIAHESEKKVLYQLRNGSFKVEETVSLQNLLSTKRSISVVERKNKLNKIDIVGFFSQKGKLEKVI